jgi:hypothetical protein
MTNENFSPEESLQLIHSMIGKTKQDLSDKSFYFFVWGWITFIACTGQFVLKHIYHSEQHYQVWWLVVVGVILSAYRGMREKRTRKFSTYIDDSIKYLWIGMGVSYFVLSAILSEIGWSTTIFPFFILLYGLGTFITGNIIRFKPLTIGGIIAWGLAIGCAYVSYDYQMLFGAAAILVSYIIPAFLLRRKSKQTHNKAL